MTEPTDSQRLQLNAQSEIDQTAEILFDMLANFEQNYPKKWLDIDHQIQALTHDDLTINDVMSVLQLISNFFAV